MKFFTERLTFVFSECIVLFFLVNSILFTTFTSGAPTDVPSPPVFRKYPERQEPFTIPVAFLSKAKLSCSVRSSSMASIQWYKVNTLGMVLLPNAKGDPFARRLKRIRENGRFLCNVSNPHGFITRQFIIKIFENFMRTPLVYDLLNVTVKEGETATLSCLAKADPLPHFQFTKWIKGSSYKVSELKAKDGRIILGITAAEGELFKHYLKIRNTTSADAGRYTCTVGNYIGLVNKDVYLNVQAVIKTKLLVPGPFNVTVKEGKTATLSCLATGDTVSHLKFERWINGSRYEVSELMENDNRISLKSVSSQRQFLKHDLTIRNSSTADAGRYTCSLGNSKGVIGKDIYLTVFPEPLPSLGKPSFLPASSFRIKIWEIVLIVVLVILSAFLFFVLVMIYQSYRRRSRTKRGKEMRVTYKLQVKS